jgi:hypothetical protein
VANGTSPSYTAYAAAYTPGSWQAQLESKLDKPTACTENRSSKNASKIYYPLAYGI